jgi:hypothetical protein
MVAVFERGKDFSMLDTYISPGSLAYVAGGFYVLGLITIHQIALRLLLLTGTGFYLLYYATVAEQPLMEAIYVSLMIGSANLIGLASLIARRSRLAIPRAYADIFERFPPLPPGDFRILMRLARRYEVQDHKVLTREGQPGRKLFFIVSGSARLRKGDSEFSVPPNLFLGEIAFLTGKPSTATASVGPGTELIEWDFEDLARKCARSSRFRLALEAAISMDLAEKVSKAIGPHAVRYPAGAPTEPWTKAG